MWRGPALLALACAGLLTACMPQKDAPVAAVPGAPAEDSCGAAALQGLVGQDRAVLSGMRFAQVLRVYEEGQPVTMDLNPGRLNIQYSKRDRIQSVTCG
ncbi:MAG: hypothetical protein JNN06_10675 [Gemmobacter sp.]|uniref:I78 family peptidase inhibitor n=1 Tax=Gemmobacter sp. TaxID=1898957 RepID=UPI001A5D0AD0|nr:I78 family peptidase inhibitor [Gemmobacter sp.]MBL8562733.1 hypothetical protein [Gemmobacter sp.]